MSTQPKSTLPDPAMEITRSILTEAAQRPWLAALLMRRRPGWLTRLAQLAQQVRDLPRHTRRALRRKLASGLAAAALLLALAAVHPVYAGTIIVNGTTCTLADAINSADSGIDTGGCIGGSAGADTISLSVDVSLTEALPNITTEITINGNNHTIQRTAGSPDFSVLTVTGGNLTLNQATISGGKGAIDGGGIANNYGTLTVQNSTISGNEASSGGGILNLQGTALVQNSTLSGNTAKYGGAIYNNAGMLTVTNSTLSGNSAVGGIGAGTGGGIRNSNGGTLLVTNSTIVNNKTANYGGGFYNAGTTTVQNSIVAGNMIGVGSTVIPGSSALPPADCYNSGTLTSGGYNIEGHETCGFTSTGDQQNVYNGTLDLLNLLPLADNEGPTWTHALGNGSAALEKIPEGTSGCGTTITTDQRGYVRPGTRNNQTDKKCEIGAWEAQTTDPYPSAITLLDLTATTNTSPGVIGAMGAALAALGALWVGRRRLKVG